MGERFSNIVSVAGKKQDIATLCPTLDYSL